MSASGFVALAGRPNVGKSTLINALVGEKVAIISDRPQTTRRAVRAVLRSGESQIVFVDLPGVQRPRDALTERMAARVRQELRDADVALLVLDGVQGVGAGDRFIARMLAGAEPPVAIAVNKTDRLSPQRTVGALEQAAGLGTDGEIFPVSARTGGGIGELVSYLAGLMPAGPFLFAPGQISDEPSELHLAELIREAAIRRTFRELPHAVEVMVDEVEPLREGLTRVRALIWVESDSQQRILVGSGGRMIKAIGIAARKELERHLGCKVHLELSVRVRPRWRADEGLLDRLGIS